MNWQEDKDMFTTVTFDMLRKIATAEGRYYQLELDLGTPCWFFVKPEFLVDVLKTYEGFDAKGRAFSVKGYTEHPAVEALRTRLARERFIERSQAVNGDTVLKPFFLNNHLLEVGERFLCASALGVRNEYKENYNDGKPMFDLPNYKKD